MDELDAPQVLHECGLVLLERRAAEVRDLRLISHWAALHGSDPRKDPAGHPRDYLVEVGGDGTPWVRDLCLGELALMRRVGWMTARAAMADVLDLQHRLPRVWALVASLDAEPWLARKVAVISRHLGLEHVGIVDAAVSRAIAGESPSRVIELARAKVIEADPAGHAARVAAERARRFVSISATDEHGLRHVIARVEAGEAVWIDAMVDRVADILAERLDSTGAPADPRPTKEVLRSRALGWMARPAELLQLLLQHAENAQDVDVTRPQTDPETDSEAAEGDLTTSRTTALPCDLLAALRSIDPTRLKPHVCLYVHITDEALADPGHSVARVEGSGPVLVDQLSALLAGAQVTVRPVIDLSETKQVTSYEHPESLRERIWLLNGRDTFPYGAGGHRRVDLDHPTPFDRSGPPGQTGTHNSQPLGRRHHRWKTHAGVLCTQVAPATYVWRTPHGHHLLVDPAGTHPISPSQAKAIVASRTK